MSTDGGKRARRRPREQVRRLFGIPALDGTAVPLAAVAVAALSCARAVEAPVAPAPADQTPAKAEAAPAAEDAPRPVVDAPRATAVEPAAVAYDPLAAAPGVEMRPSDYTVHDWSRNRDIPIRVYLRPGGKRAPVVLFSHGLGGSRTGCAYLGRHWASCGYAAVFLQHPGSDDSVWRDQPLISRRAAMVRAASGRNLLLRVGDVRAVLGQLAAWNDADEGPLRGRLDLTRVGMSGHSFGAITTQAACGQAFAGVQPRSDSRIRAAIAFSPSAPKRGDAAVAFGSVRIPWMLMTGTRDSSPINDTDVADRRAVYPALACEKYELVLFDAEHSAFTDRALPGDTRRRKPNHHRAILALSTAFWDACLRQSPDARAWLQGDGARSVLEPEDEWRFAPAANEGRPRADAQ